MRSAFVAFLVIACSRSGPDSTDSARGVSFAATPSTEAGGQSAQTCGVDGKTTLSGAGVGDLQIGRTVADVRRLCTVLRDTTILGGEALPERVLQVLTSRDTLDATLQDERVWRIEVDRPSLRTTDSLGVGAKLADLLKALGATGAEGEGVLYVMLPLHCGLSFRLRTELAANQHREHWTANDLRRLPASSTVSQVLVSGCQSAKPLN